MARSGSSTYDSGAQGTIVGAVKRAAALDTTYARGISLANSGKVLTCQAYEKSGEDIVRLGGAVLGSGTTYAVRVSLDFDSRQVLDHACTCPAHAKYAGMCKHTVALALNYLYMVGLYDGHLANPCAIQYVDKPPVPSAAAFQRPPAPAPRPAPKPVPKTSPQIEKLVNGYADQAQRASRRMLAQAVEPTDVSLPPVELECTIKDGGSVWRSGHYDDIWNLGLRVVRGKAGYVVKNINELVEAWQSGLTITYGKNLSFAHRKEAFSDTANQLLELLARVVEVQRSVYDAQLSRNSYYHSYSQPSARELPLSTGQLAELARMYEGRQLTYERETYEMRRGYYKKRAALTVRIENPHPTVRIEHDAAEGVWHLMVGPEHLDYLGDDRVLCMVMGDVLYVCDEAFANDLGVFFQALLPMHEPLNITEEDMPGFCAAVLPALRTHVQLDAPDDIEAFLPPVASFEFHIAQEEDKIVCHPTVVYDGERLDLYADVYQQQVVRHVEREMMAQQVVRAYFPFGDHRTPNYSNPLPGPPPRGGQPRARLGISYYSPSPIFEGDPWFAKDNDDAYYLLFSEGLAKLSELGDVYLSERLRRVTVREAPSVQVEANVSGGLLDLSVDAEDMDPAELMAYLASYRRRQRYVRLNNGDIVKLDGSIATVVGLVDGLGISDTDLASGTTSLPANRTLFVDAMLKRAEGIGFSRNAAFRRIVRDFETIADADYSVPSSIVATLRPYQDEGFRWLCTLGSMGFGGILADDMGLGKTLQAMAYLAHAREQGADLPALVVCPASLVYNWSAEFARFAPQMEVCVVAGSKSVRMAAIAAAPDSDVLVTSYDLMKRDIDAYVDQQFCCVVLDEAHYIKNANTQVARAAKRLVCDMRLALTGTPIENRLTELWSIFDFLMPGVLGTRDSFVRRFATPISGGDEAAAERLRRLVSPFVLRRLKRDVLRDLPDKNENVMSAVLAGEQDKLYRASAQRLRMQVEHQLPEEFAGMRLQVLAELTKLRQICCDPHLAFENYHGGSAKLDMCMELVSSAVDGGHQLLLFSQFTTMLERIAARLDAAGISYLTLTGATPKQRRQQLVEQFQAGGASVFLISLKAGGVGLNLTAADIVIHYDPWWNVAAEDQATDRTHRIGQTREVSVFKLIAQGTIEEKIVQMQQDKRALADAVIGGEGVGTTTITRDDILALLEG